MTLITSTSNPGDLTLTLVAEFPATPAQVWSLWEDPRQLERWWGPEPYPATFTRYEFTPGGECRYYMTGPDDFTHHGWWQIESIDAPHRLVFSQGLSGDDGEPVPGLSGVRAAVTFEATGGGTRMTVENHFPDAQLMEKMSGGGMDQGMSQAIGQMDALLAEVGSSTSGRA